MTQHTVWRACRRLFVFALALSATLVAGVTPASAAKGVVTTFGESGTGAGQFTFPSGVAINQATGDLYVADVGGDFDGQRMLQFTAAGDFVRAWGWGVATGADAFEVCTSDCQAGIRGSGDGQFSFQIEDPSTFARTTPQVAVDQSDGSVYVTDTLNDRVQKFTAAGAYVGQFGGSGSGDGQLSFPRGVAVDPVSGDVYVGDTNNNRVQRFDSAGAYQSQLGTPGGGSGDGDFLAPAQLAVDSTGRLYVLDTGNARVQRFTDTGAFDSSFAAGAYVSPTDLAIDPADDHVYIAATTADFSTTGILEFAPDGTAVDVHAANSGLGSAGIAIQSSTGRIYVSSPTNPTAILVLDDVTPPTVTIEPVTDITAEGAVFNGTVNPQGDQATFYVFQYSTDGASWISVPAPPGGNAGTGTSDVPVPQTVTGLDPNVEYRVRLVATKQYNAASATSAETTFTTAAAPPLVRALAAGSRTDTSVWLGGEVNPRNLPTSYYVEYTLADDLTYAQSARVPADPDTVDVGAGNSYVTVRQLVTGLQPGTDYRFRVVAVNDAGTTEGPDGVFTTRKAPPEPPAGRAYEMVSPLDKNGADVDRNLPADVSSTSGAAASGDAVAYAAQGQFAGIESGAPQGQYRSVRTAAGWTTRGINAPLNPTPVNDAVSPSLWALSDDLSYAVVSTNVLLTPNASLLGGSWGVYLQNNAGFVPSYDLLSAPPVALTPEPPQDIQETNRKLRFNFSGASSDFKHVVIEANERQLTPDGPASGRALYAWDEGQVRFVSELPSGAPAFLPFLGARDQGGQYYPGDHAVSEDGERIFFTASNSLYVREGDTTRAVSESDVDGQLGTGFFYAASADGSHALFTSAERLTGDAKAQAGECQASNFGTVTSCFSDLYLWDANAGPGGRLEDLTTTDDDGGGVLGVAAATDDLSRAFFVAGGALTPDGVADQPNLYMWTPAGGVRHVATLSEQDTEVWNTEREVRTGQYRDARLSDDGSRLLFTSRARLTAADNGGHKQVYLYDTDTAQLRCVSCPADDAPAGGPAWLLYPPDLGPSPTVEVPRAPLRLPRNLSADGRRVFFETAQGLVDGDANGKADVYMWSDGELSLITTGKSGEESEFIDASASGDNVFFTTREQLVGVDIDHQVDVYDARVGGGIAAQNPAVPEPCVGDGCQGPPAPRPALPTPTDAPEAGNPPVAKRASFSVAKLSAASRRALARGRKASVVVRVNRPGRVTVRGTARFGKRAKTVMSATKRARGAGRVRLPLRLTNAGRERLANTGRLRVSLSVRFSGADGPRVLTLALARASTSGKGR